MKRIEKVYTFDLWADPFGKDTDKIWKFTPAREQWYGFRKKARALNYKIGLEKKMFRILYHLQKTKLFVLSKPRQ